MKSSVQDNWTPSCGSLEIGVGPDERYGGTIKAEFGGKPVNLEASTRQILVHSLSPVRTVDSAIEKTVVTPQSGGGVRVDYQALHCENGVDFYTVTLSIEAHIGELSLYNIVAPASRVKLEPRDAEALRAILEDPDTPLGRQTWISFRHILVAVVIIASLALFLLSR